MVAGEGARDQRRGVERQQEWELRCDLALMERSCWR
jgi:hypothetical protein